MIRKLTHAEVPSGSLIGWVSDAHIPIHHEAATRLMCEAWEHFGVTHIAAGGDVLDLHCLSRHPKEPDRIIAQGTLHAEVEPGRWLLDFFSTRPCWFFMGNHEDRWDRFVVENPALYGTRLEDIIDLPGEVIPTDGELRLGNLVLEHGHYFFAKGTGGRFPAQRMLDMSPDESRIIGHLHRQSQARRTSRDENGVLRTRAAFTMGHMSRQEKHTSYAGKNPNWQMGFGLIRVWWEGNRPRWDVTQVEVLFDRRNRPYFALWGKVFQ